MAKRCGLEASSADGDGIEAVPENTSGLSCLAASQRQMKAYPTVAKPVFPELPGPTAARVTVIEAGVCQIGARSPYLSRKGGCRPHRVVTAQADGIGLRSMPVREVSVLPPPDPICVLLNADVSESDDDSDDEAADVERTDGAAA